MTEQKKLYIYQPISIIRDKRLTHVEKNMLCLIGSLQNNKGCTASNNWFGDYFGFSRNRAIEVIGNLKRKKFISSQEIKSGGKTVKRILKIIDEDSKRALLTNGKESLQRLVRNSKSDSKESYNQIINNKTKDKIKAESLPLPVKEQARPLPESEKLEACKNFNPLKKKLGMSTDHQPLDEQDFKKKRQDQINKLYA